MIKNYRFDQIFHQHYHYFSYNSLKNLVERLGCKIINKDINKNFWGGSLMIAFKKNDNKKLFVPKNQYLLLKKKIQKNYSLFKTHYKLLNKKLIKEKITLGYGAGQMTPSFAYHLKSDLSFLDYIVDDNKQRDNKQYPYIKTKIKFFDKNLFLNKKVVITALDGVSPISRKMDKMGVYCISPLVR